MQHNVFFWIKEEHKNAELIAEFEAGLNVISKISNVTTGGWGTPAKVAPRPVVEDSYDYGLYCTFDNVAEHDAYQVHADHQAFLNRFKPLFERVLVLDVE